MENNSRVIDIIEITRIIWREKWLLLKVLVVFVIIGLVIALTSPKEFTTTATLIPETGNELSPVGGSLGGLASLAGFDLSGLSGGSTNVSPALYQSVSKSTPFLLELMNQEFYFEELDRSISLFDYYKDHYKMGLIEKLLQVPGKIKRLIRSDGDLSLNSQYLSDSVILNLTEEQQLLVEDLQSRIHVEVDWDLNLVNIQVEMQEPLVVAEMTKFTQDYITEFVVAYAINKSKLQLASVEKQYISRKNEFEIAQSNLANFRDRNQNVKSAKFKSEEERLVAEYNLAFNIFDQIAQQREAIKVQILSKTPVFTVLEPVKVPVEKSKPRRGLIMITFLLLGLVVGSLVSVGKTYLVN